MFFITIFTATAYYIFKIQVHPTAGQAKPHMHTADCHAVREEADTHHVVMTVCGLG